MALNFNARIEDDLTRIEFRDGAASIDIVNSKDTGSVKGTGNSIYFLVEGKRLVYIGKTDKNRSHTDKEFDKYILISAPPEIDKSYLEYYYVAISNERKIALVNSVSPAKPRNITVNKEKNTKDFIVDVDSILVKFGFDLFGESSKKYKKNTVLSTTEKEKKYKDYKIITIGGRMTRIYINDNLYEGNMQEKLREIAKDAKIDYSNWPEYKRKGTVHFAAELIKRLP